MSLLSIENLTVKYKGITALDGIDMHIEEGEVVSVLGPNGAGKTTLLRAITGLVPPENGSSIRFRDDQLIGTLAYRIVKKGISHVPEGRQVFPLMSVHENLEVAGVNVPVRERQGRIDTVYQLFSELSTRKSQQAGSLSGGEQQMLAIGRALVSKSDIVLIDEPSMGLAPVIVKRIFKTLKEIVRSTHLTLLIVEQNAKLSLPLSDRIYVLSQGKITMHEKVSDIRDNQVLRDMYFSKQ